jgi:hypothetical protein
MTKGAYQKMKHPKFPDPPAEPGFYYARHRSGMWIIVNVPKSLAAVYRRYDNNRKICGCYGAMEIIEWGEKVDEKD